MFHPYLKAPATPTPPLLHSSGTEDQLLSGRGRRPGHSKLFLFWPGNERGVSLIGLYNNYRLLDLRFFVSGETEEDFAVGIIRASGLSMSKKLHLVRTISPAIYYNVSPMILVVKVMVPFPDDHFILPIASSIREVI